jgi:pimeloyl-ACP methyl ester carboxylesterase
MKTVVALAVPFVFGLMALPAHSAPIRATNGSIHLNLEYPATMEHGGEVVRTSAEYSYKILENIVPQDIVLIHGNLASNTWWMPTALDLRRRVLADRRLGDSPTESYHGRLIMIEWPGYGKSSAPNRLDELRPEVVGEAIVQILKTLKVEKAHIVGHSTGGLYALYAVQRAPKMFDKILLLDSVGPNGLFWPWEALANYRFGLLEKAIKEGDRDWVENVIAGTIKGVDRTSPFFKRLVDEAMNAAPMNIQGLPQVLFNLNREAMNPIGGAQLGPIKNRTLILFGENDEVLPYLTHSPGLKSVLPNSELRLVPNAGHSLNVENPKEFTDIMVGEFALLPTERQGLTCHGLWL